MKRMNTKASTATSPTKRMPGRALDAFGGMRFAMVSFLAREPKCAVLYQLLIKRAQRRKRKAGENATESVVEPHTELVIDGFQGCANTFLTEAFKYSQARPVRLAHHLHAPVQIIRAVEMEIPTIVTIRDPRGAALSLISRWPYISVPQALRSYIGFYKRIQPYAYGYVLSPFDRTTQRADEVIEAVNEKFNTDFNVFTPTPENMAAVRPLSPGKKARMQKRKAVRQQKAPAFASQKNQLLLAKAETLYAAFMKEAGLAR